MLLVNSLRHLLRRLRVCQPVPATIAPYARSASRPEPSLTALPTAQANSTFDSRERWTEQPKVTDRDFLSGQDVETHQEAQVGHGGPGRGAEQPQALPGDPGERPALWEEVGHPRRGLGEPPQGRLNVARSGVRLALGQSIPGMSRRQERFSRTSSARTEATVITPEAQEM